MSFTTWSSSKIPQLFYYRSRTFKYSSTCTVGFIIIVHRLGRQYIPLRQRQQIKGTDTEAIGSLIYKYLEIYRVVFWGLGLSDSRGLDASCHITDPASSHGVCILHCKISPACSVARKNTAGRQ